MASETRASEDGIDISTKPCRVTEVALEGLVHTQADLIKRELDGVRSAATLGELYGELQTLLTELGQLDVFSGVDVTITETQRREEGKCRLEMRFQEKTLWTLRAKTFVQGSEAGVEGRFGLRNLRGLGEKLTCSMEYGSHSLKESAIEYLKPRILGSSANFHAKLLNFTKSNQHFSSSQERLKALDLTLSSPDRLQSLSYGLGWHQLVDEQYQASPAVQSQLGHGLKSSLQYQLLYDKRDSRQLSSGCALRWMAELNGLWPHASMSQSLKSRGDAQLSWKWMPWSSISVGAAAGALFPLRSDFSNATTSVTERFYMGGVDSLKGFHPNRLGPSMPCRPVRNASDQRRTRDYLGGDVMASAYASLNVFQRSLEPGRMGIYARIFGDVGNVAPLSSFTSGPLKEQTRQFASEYRASVGMGIVMPTPVGNFEVNYVLPMRYGKHDTLRGGLQMSFGTEPFTA